MLDVWRIRTSRAPHPLCDTEPLPKFKHMPFYGKRRKLSEDEWRALFLFPPGTSMGSSTCVEQRPKAAQLHLLDDLLAEGEDLEPIMVRRSGWRNDIWDFKAGDKNMDALLDEVSELNATDERAVAASNLAQVAVQALPLMVLEGQLYCQTGTTWQIMSKREFLIAAEENPPMQAVIHGFGGRSRSDFYERVTLQRSIQRNAVDVQMPPSLIPCRDGVFDIETMRAREVRPDDYFFSCCDVPVEEIGKGSGEQFETFIASVSGGNPAVRQQVLEMIGIIISGYMPKKFFLLLGPRDTGKSQIMNLLRNLIGDQCTQSISDPNELSGPWMSGSLVGKRLCYCPDAARVALSQKSAAALKQLTGGDLIQANVKYKQPFTFRNEATIVFVSNHPLAMPRDEVLESRLVTIPFSNSIPKERQVPNFSELLYRERGYIVGAAVEALKDLADRHFQFTRADSATQVPTCAFGGSIMEQIARFVEERCQLDPDGKEYSDTRYQAFCAFSEGNGGSSVSREVFSRTLNSIVEGLESLHTSRQRGYRGIRLRDNFPAN